MAEHDHSHEQTPLLQDQDNDQDQDQDGHHHLSHQERTQNLVEGIRNVFENQIPNGHHTTPPSSPKKIHALLPRLFSLINSLVDSEGVEDDIITNEVVEFLASLGKEVVYGLLRCVETFLDEGEHDVGRKRLLERRAVVTQIAAAAVVKVFVKKDMMATYCHILTRPYFAVDEESNTAENAIEIAIRVHATDFLADVEVQRCVQALWNGLILQTEDDECRVRFVEYSGVRRSRHNLWEWIDVGRLNVPKYQNNMRIAMFIVFLILYTYIVNDRTVNPTTAEWALYVVVCGYIFEEFRLIFEGGTAFFLGSIWHWINIFSYSVFIVCFALRFTAHYLINDEEVSKSYTNMSYDLMALLAVFLWVKTLSLLDGMQYFGTMVMVLQKMLKDGIMFFWLLAWVFIGFFQSFYALKGNDVKDAANSGKLLIRGFLQDPDWDLALEQDPAYGFWLFALYLFLTSIILLNLLVALFNSSYTNITDSSEKEYLALFTFKVFSYLKSPDEFPYAAPFNLIEVFFVIPWSAIVSKDAYRKLNKVVMGFLFGVPVLVIAVSERKRYLKLKNTDNENDIQGGRRIYRHLAAEEDDLDDLFLLATREFDPNSEESAIPSTTAATIAQAEEGIIHAGTQDAGRKSSQSPLETFDEFRERRKREKEAKAATVHKVVDNHVPDAGGASSATRAPAPETGSSGQLTDTLVQSLLASLARMEERQKDLELLLQTHIDREKEVNAIAQASVAAVADEAEVPSN
ncbi:hypothetical protein BGZ75_008005 [Mortierella antarctica]|nr:hypothetical protein BGZ67_001066 [Mortierella alpina]KAF9988980.1 hypothetical protein BGZ75_008005 [Mortierella antarctica]